MNRAATGPAWPFSPESAARVVAAVAWPGEVGEQRDEWSRKMLHDAELRDRTIEKARDRFDAAVRALIDPTKSAAALYDRLPTSTNCRCVLVPIEDDLGGIA